MTQPPTSTTVSTAAARDASETPGSVLEMLARELVASWPAATVDARRQVASVLDAARSTVT